MGGQSTPQRTARPGEAAFRLDFVCVGAQRAGTTWLDEALRPHPDIILPSEVKETFFFDRHYAKGLPWYASHFAAPGPGQVVGEIGPSYLDEPGVADRIHAVSPECRILVILRHPVERAVSLFHHYARKGKAPACFADAVAARPQIVSSSHYAQHLELWFAKFGRDAVKVMLFEDLIADPQAAMAEVCGFIGVPPQGVRPPDEAVNQRTVAAFPVLARTGSSVAAWLRASRLHGLVNLGKSLGLKRIYEGGSGPAPVSAAERAALCEAFADDVTYVERLLSRRLDDWRRPDGGGAEAG